MNREVCELCGNDQCELIPILNDYETWRQGKEVIEYNCMDCLRYHDQTGDYTDFEGV